MLRASPRPAPLVLGPPDERRTFGAWELNEVRASVAAMLRAAGFGRDRTEDVVLAVNEIATNAVEHGPGDAELCLWSDADGVRAPRCTTAGVLGNPLPGLHGAAPGGAARARASGSPGSSATRCTSGPTQAAPTSGCARRPDVR